MFHFQPGGDVFQTGGDVFQTGVGMGVGACAMSGKTCQIFPDGRAVPIAAAPSSVQGPCARPRPLNRTASVEA